MNYGELKAAVLSDSNRADYSVYVARFIEQGEGKISQMLDGYIITRNLTDAQRVLDGQYVLPNYLTVIRTVKYNNLPLDQVDAKTIAYYRTINDVLLYCMKDSGIHVAGIPPAASILEVEYYGMPDPLRLGIGDIQTNSLLTDYPDLYIEAAQIFVYKRARNWDAADRMEASVRRTCASITRKVRKRMGGAKSANPYNTDFKSSY